jgi:hypothetical protein
MTQTIDSEYFAEDDIMAMQSELIENERILINQSEEDPLMDPAFLAKALDRLVNSLVAEIVSSPAEMLFGACDGNYRWEFERAIKYVERNGVN